MAETKTLVIGGAVIGVVALVVLWQVRKDAVALVGAAGDAINPLNPHNAAASTVNAVGEALTGNKDWSLGISIYDLFHSAPDQPAATK